MSGLEETLKDSYTIYFEAAAEEKQQKQDALVQRIEQLQQQYGTEKILVYRRFEFIPAVAAVIKEKNLVELLQKEGYIVERQGEMKASQPDATH